MVDIDKLRSCKVRLDNQLLDLTDCWMDLETLLALLVQSNVLKMVVTPPRQPAPSSIIAEGIRLRNMLWYLIDRAVQYT